MSSSTLALPISLEQFLEIERNAPEGSRFALIDGELKEYEPMTTRNLKHSTSITRIGHAIWKWLDNHPNIGGGVAGGEARCRLTANPECIVGLDVAYFGAENCHDTGTGMFEGPPLLAVEVLFGSDTHDDIVNRIDLFLNAGVRQVWIADPDLQTVTVHRPDTPPRLFSREQSIAGEPELPGFTTRVGLLFSREG